MDPVAGESTQQRRGPLFYIGAAGLLAAMAVEVVAVAGRHLSWPAHGALELIQTAILITATVSMVSATLGDSHATVHLLTTRLPATPKRWLERLAAVLSVIFFLGLAAGGIWLAADHWHAHEETELLRIPLRPLRVLSCLSILAIAGLFFSRAVMKRAEPPR